ncbi:glycosyl hydrolase family 28-related protein [Streptacidiphilus monticola]
MDSEDTASSYTIDFADFEQVGGALAQPAGSVSVTDKGADPTGVNDSTSAFNAAIAAAGSGGTVWIPQGTFKIPGHIAVNNVTIAGAGMWYSTVTGAAPASTATPPRARAPGCTCRTSPSSATCRSATTAPRSTRWAGR